MRTYLEYPRTDGQALREHLEQVEAATGTPQIEEPDVPSVGAYLWGWFWALSPRRGRAFGLAPLTFADMAAWATLMREQPAPWEIEAIMAMDQVYLAEASKAAKE